MEPDHSGSISLIRKYYPNMTIVGNKNPGNARGYYGIDDNTLEISDGEVLSLGKHKLQFHFHPWFTGPKRWWPTIHETENVLFSGDAFGCFWYTRRRRDGYGDEYWINTGEMIRYYANIGENTELRYRKDCKTHCARYQNYLFDPRPGYWKCMYQRQLTSMTVWAATRAKKVLWWCMVPCMAIPSAWPKQWHRDWRWVVSKRNTPQCVQIGCVGYSARHIKYKGLVIGSPTL